MNDLKQIQDNFDKVAKMKEYVENSSTLSLALDLCEKDREIEQLKQRIKELEKSQTKFKVGDIVYRLSNNYEKRIYNYTKRGFVDMGLRVIEVKIYNILEAKNGIQWYRTTSPINDITQYSFKEKDLFKTEEEVIKKLNKMKGDLKNGQ